jgi:hypothetical protein
MPRCGDGPLLPEGRSAGQRPAPPVVMRPSGLSRNCLLSGRLMWRPSVLAELEPRPLNTLGRHTGSTAIRAVASLYALETHEVTTFLTFDKIRSVFDRLIT